MAATSRTLLLMIFVGVGVAQPVRADTLVVCPSPWQAVMEGWVAHRQSQGHAIEFAAPGPTAEDTKAIIQKRASSGGLRWVVLVGDAGRRGQPAARVEVPTTFVPAVINRRWGSESHLATDYDMVADLPHSDQSPIAGPIAIGRIPCDTPVELRDYLARVIAFESDVAGELGEQRLTLVAAPGNFSPLLDRLIEGTAARILSQLTPPTCALHMTYADWRSPYCPYPPRFAQAVQEGMQRRSTAWVYLGHGHRHTLDRLQTPAGHARILDTQLVASLQGKRFPPLAALIACYAGSFDGPDDCLAEQLLKQPGGPLATLAGSRVTMPYGNSVLGLELLKALFADSVSASETKTVGELIAVAKQGTLAERKQGIRKTVEQIAAGLTPKQADRTTERLEHVRMYNLLGDPLLRLRQALPMKLVAKMDPARPGQLKLRGASPLGGNCRLSVVRARPAAASLQGNRKSFELSSDSQSDYERQYKQNNARAIISRTLAIEAGQFAAQLEIPADVQGELLLVCHVAGRAGCAAGHTTLVR